MKTLEYNDNPDFNEFLDEVFGEISIAGFSYSCSKALFTLDVTAYEESLENFKDEEERE